jgi:hypothetical protein
MSDTISKTLQVMLRVDGVQQGEKQVDRFNQAISGLSSAVKSAVVGFVGWKALNIASEFIKEAAELQKTAAAWESVTVKMGVNGRQLLEQMKVASRGTVSEIDMMMQGIRANVMGIPMENLPRLMEIAKAAARGMGQTTSFMFESIVLGIARQSRLILDNLGIIVSEEKVYEEATARLGHELSDTEKKQAFLNEVLKQGQSIIDKVGSSTDSLSDIIERGDAAWKEFKGNLGSFIAIVAGPTLQFWADFISVLNRAATQSAETKAAVEDLNKVAASKIPNPETPNEKLLNFELDNLKQYSAELESVRNEYGATNDVLIAMFQAGAKFSTDENNKIVQYINLLGKIAELQRTINKYKQDEVNTTVTVEASAKEGYEAAILSIEKLRIQGKISLAETLAQYKTLLSAWGWVADARLQLDKKIFETEVQLEQEKLDKIKQNIEAELEIRSRLLSGAIEETKKATKPNVDFEDTTTKKFWEEVKDSWNKYEGDAGRVIHDSIMGLFEGLNSVLPAWANGMVSTVENLLSGNITGAVSSFVGTIVGMLSGEHQKDIQTQADLKAAMKAAREETDRLVDSLYSMTQAEKDAIAADAEREIRSYEHSREHAKGDKERYDEAKRLLAGLRGEMVDEEDIRKIKDFGEALQYLTNPENLDYQKGQDLISYWSDMFDLTTEQQIALWQQLLDTLKASGGLSIGMEQSIQRSIKNLQDQKTSEAAQQQQSQTYRSVTSITERQANNMLAVLNSMSLYLRQILEALRAAGSGIVGGLPVATGGRNIIISGNMNFYPQTNNAEAFAKDFVKYVRSKGGNVA